MTWEHDLHLYLKRAKADEVALRRRHLAPRAHRPAYDGVTSFWDRRSAPIGSVGGGYDEQDNGTASRSWGRSWCWRAASASRFRRPITPPAPPPLQPYLGPPYAVAAPATTRVVKHRRVKKRHKPSLPLHSGAVSDNTLRLIAPSLDKLAQYEAALAAGWSPDTERDVSGEQLAALRRNPHAFLFDLTRQDGTIVTASGREVRRLPSRVFWLDDGEFCGMINLRFLAGSDALPDYVSGHIGYAVVPWKRRRGYATRGSGDDFAGGARRRPHPGGADLRRRQRSLPPRSSSSMAACRPAAARRRAARGSSSSRSI